MTSPGPTTATGPAADEGRRTGDRYAIWRMPRLTDDQIRALPARVDFPYAARALGYGYGAAYRAVRRGEWPADVPVIKGVSRGWLVDKARLMQHLGIEPVAPAR